MEFEHYLNKQFAFVFKKNKKIIAMYDMSFFDKLKLDYFFISSVKKNKCETFQMVMQFSLLSLGAAVIGDYGASNEGMKFMSCYLQD